MAEYKEVFCNKCFNQTSACESCSVSLNCKQSANDKFDSFSPATSAASSNIGSCSKTPSSALNEVFLSTDISIDTNENVDKVNNFEICRGPLKNMMSEAVSATSSITNLDESCSLLSSLCKSLEKHSSCSKINDNILSRLAFSSNVRCSNESMHSLMNSSGICSNLQEHNDMGESLYKPNSQCKSSVGEQSEESASASNKTALEYYTAITDSSTSECSRFCFTNSNETGTSSVAQSDGGVTSFRSACSSDSPLSVSCAIVSKIDCSNTAAGSSGGVRSKNCHHNFMLGSKLPTSALNANVISNELSTNKCMHNFSLNGCESQSCHQHDFNDCNLHTQSCTGVVAQASCNCNGMNVKLPSHTLTHIVPTVSKCSICHSFQCNNQHSYCGGGFDGSSSLIPQPSACSQCGGQHDVGLMHHIYNPNCEIHGQAQKREHVLPTASTLSQSRNILSDSRSPHYRKHVTLFNFAGDCDIEATAFNRDFGCSSSSCQSSSMDAIHHCCNQDTSIRRQNEFSKIQPNSNLMPVHMASCQMNNNRTNAASYFSNNKETACSTFSSCDESFDDGRKYSCSDTSCSTSVNKVKQLSSEATLGQHTSSKGSLNHTYNCPSYLGVPKPNLSFQQCKSHSSCSSLACNFQSPQFPISINYNGSGMSINSAGNSNSGCGHWCSSCQVKLKCTDHSPLSSENVNRSHHVEIDKEEAASYFNESPHIAVFPIKEDGAAVKSDSTVQPASKNSLKSKVIQKFSRSRHRVPCKELSGAAIKKKKRSFPLWMVCLSLANKGPLVCPSISNVKEQFPLPEDAQTNAGATNKDTMSDIATNKSREGSQCDLAILSECSEITDSTETITTCKSQQASHTNCRSLSMQLPNSSSASPRCYSGVGVHCSSDDEERECNETFNSINAIPDNVNNSVVHQATGNVPLPWAYKSMWEVQMLLERSFRFGLSGPGIVSQEQIAQQMERLNECASGDRPVPSISKSASGGSTVSLWQQQTVHTQVDYIHCLVPDLLAITSCSFYWGKMDRYEAEGLLENRPEGTFLLRDSAQDEFLFSVSFRRYSKSLHVRIEQGNHKFSFDSRDPGVFASDTVCGLIEHYKDPSCCMFFEPILTNPLCRNFAFPLQHLCRATICSRTTYDGINKLQIPKILRNYLKEYHYKQLVGVRRLDH